MERQSRSKVQKRPENGAFSGICTCALTLVEGYDTTCPDPRQAALWHPFCRPRLTLLGVVSHVWGVMLGGRGAKNRQNHPSTRVNQHGQNLGSERFTVFGAVFGVLLTQANDRAVDGAAQPAVARCSIQTGVPDCMVSASLSRRTPCPEGSGHARIDESSSGAAAGLRRASERPRGVRLRLPHSMKLKGVRRAAAGASAAVRGNRE